MLNTRKKYFVQIILGLFLSVIIGTAACSPRVSTPELTVAMSLSEEEWGVLRQKVFPVFEKQFKVRIKAYQVESEHLVAKLEALQHSRVNAIDVFAQDNMTLSALVSRGLVEDLSSSRSSLSKNILPNLIDACLFNKRLFFLPFRPNVQIVYYNKQAFAKYNLAVPRNWEALLKQAQFLKNAEGVGRVLLKGFGGNPTATQVYEFILQAGGDPYAFNDAGCVTAFEFLQQLRPYLSPETSRAKWDTVNDILARQEAYLSVNWPFGVVVLIKNYGLSFIDTYSGWSGPAGEKHVIGGDVFGIPVASENKDLSLKFINFMHSKEIQEILVSELGWPSIRDDAYSQVADWQKKHFSAVKEALSKGVFRENVTWWPAYKKYVNNAFRDIVMNGEPVKATLDKYKAELEQEKKGY